MAAPTVYQNVADDALDGAGQLFAGRKFWVAMRCPSRIKLLEDIKANGGEIVPLEKNADYLIADHCRKDAPPGSLSYEFVTKSIRDGALRDPDDHAAGPPLGELRPAGSISRPAKGSRRPYTAEEDRILYKWVHDIEKAGGLPGGNTIYQDFAKNYPQHTWQSWRDHYLKFLRNRPPSAFSIPDNAPPSPPSDQSNDRILAAATSSKEPTGDAAKTEKPAGIRKTSGIRKARAKEEYSIKDLEGLFDVEDWEQLYGSVAIIDSNVDDELYNTAWEQWAEHQANQTAEQWRQYYEKVVRPQWLRDPVSKRKAIAKKLEEKNQSSDPAPSQAFSQEEHEDQVEEQHNTQGMNPRVRKKTKEAVKAPVDIKYPSSTARPESPRWLNDMVDKAKKRSQEDLRERESESAGRPNRPAKRRKSASPAPTSDDRVRQVEPVGSQIQPLEISSTESVASSYSTDSVELEQRVQNRSIEASIQLELGTQIEGLEEIDEHSDDFPSIQRLISPQRELNNEGTEDLPSNTPTPKAKRHVKSKFDTQAILSSPSPELPQPFYYTEERGQHNNRASPFPMRVPESDSTTQSLQEFRQSLTAEDIAQMAGADVHPDNRPASPSPAPSSTSSAGSGDPDVPLEADEFEEFYEEQHAEGFNDAFITAALKRTRMRPGLAIEVLEAWGEGNPLPNTRGIWSIEDDQAVQSGDGLVLALLQRKHTMDGWGGITERINFLQQYNNR